MKGRAKSEGGTPLRHASILQTSLPRRRTGSLVLAVAVLGAGCAGPSGTAVLDVGEVSIAGYEKPLRQIRNDPVAFLRQCLAESRKLKTLRTEFLRQERLGGLVKRLMPAEHIIVDYRDDPFSVRFTWTDADAEYDQCVYVEGRNQNRVALLPRKGLFGLPASIGNYPAPWGVLFNKTRNPITDFGPRRMMERTLDRIKKAQPLGEVKINVIGLAEVGPEKQRCFHFEIRYPPRDEYACKLQDLFIDVETRLPVETRLWLTHGNKRTPETLDAVYRFTNLQPNVEVTDAHFVIEARRDKGKGSKKTQSRPVRAAATTPKRQ